MRTVISDFFDALNREETKLVPRLASDRLGVYLKCALSELDLAYYHFTREGEADVYEEERFHILQLGVARLVFLALASRPSFDAPVVTFRRSAALSKEVVAISLALGMIQHGRRIAQYIALGVGEISKNDQGVFSIKLPERLIDNSGHERASLELFILQSRQRFASLMQTKSFRKLEEQVEEKLSELVYPWEDHFIGYDADPLLDDYFFGLAYHNMQLQEGFDTFHFALKFGGVCYQNYVLALTFLMSNYIRHQRFAEALIRKNESTKLENVLTITSDTDPFIADLLEAVNYFGKAFKSFEELGEEEAKTVFSVLSYGRHSLDLGSAPGAPLPPIVQCSDQGFIRCITGARSEPMRFLLEALRHHFPLDYDRNQRSREGSFQRAIKRILGEAFSKLEFRDNLKAKVNGKLLTDIDLVVVEKTTGVVLLCQLKWQDVYGFNFHAERVRGERLVDQAEDWLVAVDTWLKQVGVDGLRGNLRLGDDFPVLNIHRLVIAKHFAHQLKDTSLNHGALYATWAQLLLATEVVSRDHVQPGLVDLINQVREIPVIQSTYEHQHEEKAVWKVGDIVFETFQAESFG